VNNLLKVVTRQCPGAESNLCLGVTSGLQVRHVTVRLPSHTLPFLIEPPKIQLRGLVETCGLVFGAEPWPKSNLMYMRYDGNNFNYFPDNQLAKFSAV